PRSHWLSATGYRLPATPSDPAAVLEHLPAEVAEEHLRLAAVLGVELEARALEVLHRVVLAVDAALLLELLGERVAVHGEAAELRQPAELVPVLEESAAQRVLRLGEVEQRVGALDRPGQRVGRLADDAHPRPLEVLLQVAGVLLDQANPQLLRAGGAEGDPAD